MLARLLLFTSFFFFPLPWSNVEQNFDVSVISACKLPIPPLPHRPWAVMWKSLAMRQTARYHICMLASSKRGALLLAIIVFCSVPVLQPKFSYFGLVSLKINTTPESNKRDDKLIPKYLGARTESLGRSDETFLPIRRPYWINRPFYSCGLSTLAFEWMRGWRWPCFDTNLLCFVMEIVLEKY